MKLDPSVLSLKHHAHGLGLRSQALSQPVNASKVAM